MRDMEIMFLLLYLFIFIIAFLYSSVGHGGASGYIAVMALSGFAPEHMRSTVLILNILVSLIAFVQYYRSGHFIVHIFLPLVIAAVPLAFLGGMTQMQDSTYKMILGILLLLPAIHFLGFYKIKERAGRKNHSVILAIFLGGCIGYISGLTGIGGGILLSPALLILHWTNQKQTAALSAGFILLNSIAGLAGLFTRGISTESHLVAFIIVALIGGLVGSYLGANRFNQLTLSRILGSVLLIASIKLLFT